MIYFDLFSISFQSLSINFDLFDIIWTRFNRFHHDHWFGFQELGSKKSIERPFNHYVSRLVDLDRLDCLSLVYRLKFFSQPNNLICNTNIVIRNNNVDCLRSLCFFFHLHFLSRPYPSMMGPHSSLGLLALIFIIGIVAHLCTRFCAVWHHQVARIAIVDKGYWHHLYRQRVWFAQETVIPFAQIESVKSASRYFR